MSKMLYPLASIAIVLAIWSTLTASGLVPAAILPAPGTVAAAAIEETTSGRLLTHLAASGQRLIIGFAIGATIGVLLGLVMGMVQIARAALVPIVEILRPIPPLAWIPLALIWFGIDEASKVFLIALTACFPVLIATMKGVQQIDLTLIRAAESLDVAPARMLASVLLPAATPDIVTGLRLGWTLAITILVGAEMIASSSGLGHLIIDGMNNGRFDRVLVGILMLGIASVATDAAFVALARSRLMRWHAGIEQAKL